jgi:MoaA/NifB/PqqE/SkfB family radical SAM enzyme
LDGVFTQARELGVHFIVLTGGEPLMREGLTDLLLKHDRLTFLFFTNGTLVDGTWVQRIARCGNIVPLISVEGSPDNTDQRRGKGVHDRAIAAMGLLQREKCLFGFSTMVCRSNIAVVGSEAYYDTLLALGCRIGFLVNYVPSSNNADRGNVPTAEEQVNVRKHIVTMQRTKRLILIHMPDDEFQNSGSCMAAGAGFVHINAQGFVEPCPFSHFATHSIRNATLKEALQSPFFAHIRNSSGLLQRPHLGCSLFEHREEVAEIAVRLGAQTTDRPYR